MISDDLTVFDIKYNEGIERLNNLLSSEPTSNSIKNYVEQYKLDKLRENINSKKIYNPDNRNTILKDEKRKQIVDIYEIRDHDKKVQQLINKNYLKNEIEWFKIKKREDEHKNKYNYNKPKFEKDFSNNRQENSKDIIRNNNLKMKKFSNLANNVNIEKFIQIKKLNQNQNFNTIQKNKEEIYDNNNNIKDGVFIPYSEYKQIEMNNKNKKSKISVKSSNIAKNPNKLNININNNSLKNIFPNKSNNIIKNNFSENNQKFIKRNNNINNLYKNINANEDKNKKINKISQSQDNNKRNIKNTAPIFFDKRYQIEIRKPLDKKIDYLREKKSSQNQRVKIYESKNLFKDNKNVLNNIEILNFHSKKYEDEAKRQELLMKVKGNKKFGNEDNVKLSNLLIDSISTKLAILNQISSKNS